MHIERSDRDGYTEILIWNEGTAVPAYESYRITCMDADWDSTRGGQIPPTARISLLTTTGADVALARRLAAEYTYVADVAEQLEVEKRAKFARTQRAAGEE